MTKEEISGGVTGLKLNTDNILYILYSKVKLKYFSKINFLHFFLTEIKVGLKIIIRID